MIAPAPYAALAGAGVIGLALWCHWRWFACLPDDPPSLPRKLHVRSMPLGGVLLAPAALPWLVSGGLGWPELGALLLATAAGYGDDLGKARGDGLDWRTKGGLLLLACLLGSAGLYPPLDDPLAWLAAAAGAFVVVNATNFLDNMNGVALTLAGTTLLALGGDGPFAALGWAALGMLPWNWPRARLFLGDAGAYLLGMGSALAALTAVRHGEVALAVAALGVQLADFVQVVTARLWLHLPPWVGDRRHLTHLLHHRGVPVWLVAPLLAALAGCLLAVTR